MEWQDRYADKTKTAREALRLVKRGDDIFVASGASEPRLLIAALDELAADWGSEALHVYSLGPIRGRFRCLVLGGTGRDSIPIAPWHIAQYLESGALSLDVALIQVTPPNEEGFCCLGTAVDIAKPAAAYAGHVIAEVNPRLPRTQGETLIPVERIAALVPNDAPLAEFPPSPPDETMRQIAQHTAKLVPNGATLQIGFGSITAPLSAALQDKRDLGLHTDILTDGVAELIKTGAITNAAKALHPGKSIASRGLGSAWLYDFLHNDPTVEFHPWHKVCDPWIVSRNERMTAINAAQGVDLTGAAFLASQEALGFIRGAAEAQGGRVILVLPSTRADGQVSNIAPSLPARIGCSLDGGEVHYVVTEYGVAELLGRSVGERVLEMIGVAHPDFRAALWREAQEAGYIPHDRQPPSGRYPGELETTATFKDGLVVAFRPVKPSDERMLRELFYALSERSLYLRFFSVPRTPPPALYRSADRIDYEREMTLVGLTGEGAQRMIVAVGRYVVDPKTNMADVALLVRDDYQRRGIGLWLLLYLGQIAQARGCAGLQADILSGNYQALGMVRKGGYKIGISVKEGYFTVYYKFPQVS